MGKNKLEKLGIGTVQFGLDYGVSNMEGQTSLEEATNILQYAKSKNIKSIDTAHLYGNSEETLGKIDESDAFKIITKTLCFRTDKISDEECQNFDHAIATSLKTLNKDKIYGLLSHHADDLCVQNGEKLFDIMQRYKDEGLVSKIGASVYDGQQIDALLEKYEIGLVQIPCNLFDQRLLKSGHLRKLKEHNVEIHIRSAFLQGIVFMTPEQLPEHLTPMRPLIEKLDKDAQELGTSKMAAALAFLTQIPEIDQIICGINNTQQLVEICEIMEDLPEIPANFFEPFTVDDPILVNPANWS